MKKKRQKYVEDVVCIYIVFTRVGSATGCFFPQLPWMTTPWAFFHVWLRVRSFSIWPVFVAHVAHNCWIELLFDPLVGRSEYLGFSNEARNKRALYFVGEFGLFAAITYMVCAMIFTIDMDAGYIS